MGTCSSSAHEKFKVHFVGSKKREEKRPTFIFTNCSRHFQVITSLVLQQPHTAVTLISSWYIWENWSTDIKGLAEDTHVVNCGAQLAFQDCSCCGVFGDRIKLIWGPLGQSRASGIQTGKLEAWEVRGPHKWVVTLGGLRESKKTYGLPPPKDLSSSAPPPFLIHTHTKTHLSPKVNSQAGISRILASKIVFLASVFMDRCRIHSTLQRMQPIPLIRSKWCQREGYLSLGSFRPQWGTDGTWPDSSLPHLYRSHEANLTPSGVFQRGTHFKIHSLSQMEHKIPLPA